MGKKKLKQIQRAMELKTSHNSSHRLFRTTSRANSISDLNGNIPLTLIPGDQPSDEISNLSPLPSPTGSLKSKFSIPHLRKVGVDKKKENRSPSAKGRQGFDLEIFIKMLIIFHFSYIYI